MPEYYSRHHTQDEASTASSHAAQPLLNVAAGLAVVGSRTAKSVPPMLRRVPAACIDAGSHTLRWATTPSEARWLTAAVSCAVSIVAGLMLELIAGPYTDKYGIHHPFDWTLGKIGIASFAVTPAMFGVRGAASGLRSLNKIGAQARAERSAADRQLR